MFTAKEKEERSVLINEENYVEKAEKAIKYLKTENKDRKGRTKKMLTTSQIRNLLSISADIYNEIMNQSAESGDKISAELNGRINYLRVRFIYEAGRDEKIKDFVEITDVLKIMDSIQGSKKNYLLFSKYMEALVAFHRYYGGKEI